MSFPAGSDEERGTRHLFGFLGRGPDFQRRRRLAAPAGVARANANVVQRPRRQIADRQFFFPPEQKFIFLPEGYNPIAGKIIEADYRSGLSKRIIEDYWSGGRCE